MTDRFLKSEKFRGVYLQAYEQAFDTLFASRWIDNELRRIEKVLTDSGAIDPATVTADAQALHTSLANRAKALPAKIAAAKNR